MNEMTRRTVLTRGTMAAAAAYLGATAVQAAGEAPRHSSGKFKAIDAAMLKAVNDRSVAGAVAMAATPKGMVYEGLFGKANPQTGATMRSDAVFWLLSMTKAITATACMQLVEQGRIKLDDDASKYLPQLAAPKVLVGFDANGQPQLRPAKNTIKVHHLLTHTSGYTYANWSDVIARYETATGLPHIATCQNAAFNVPLEFDPASVGSTASAWIGLASFRPIPGSEAQMGLFLRNQHRARTAWPLRRQRILGRTAQLLLLDRSSS